MSMKKDGWVEVKKGIEVLVEDGRVVRATKTDMNGGITPAAVYRESEYGGMVKVESPKYDTFRKNFKSEKWAII